MSISLLQISQDNKVGNANVFAIHSPLIFLVDADYTGLAPDYLYVDIEFDETLIGTFKCIPHSDISTNERRFMFIADTILQGYMADFDDIEQANETLIHIPNITREFKLTFRDPASDAEDVYLFIVAMHSARQFGESPSMFNQYANIAETIYTSAGKPCYAYFYNNSGGNIVGLLPSQFSTFVISDSVGFVENAKVTIGGQEIFSNELGVANVQLANGVWPYTISRSGYADFNGSVTVNDDFFNIPITLTELTQLDVTINLNADSGVIYIYTEDQEWWTNPTPYETVAFAGGVGVAHDLYYPMNYRFKVVPVYCDLYQPYNAINLTGASMTLTLTAMPLENFSVIVKDANTLLPISGADLWIKSFDAWQVDPNNATTKPACFPLMPDSDVNGESEIDYYNARPENSWSMTLYCYAAGYNDYGKYVNKGDTQPIVILMQPTP